jgi:amino-acid N-acetyltransferase
LSGTADEEQTGSRTAAYQGGLNMIRIIPTDDHDSLNGFYAGNDLEISEDDPTDTSAVKSWKLYDGDDFAGATTLAYRQGDFIIDGIAVDKDHRGSMLGTGLLKTALAEARRRGAERVFLVARAPEFFRANGFTTVPREEAPEFFECAGCDQYNVSCFPEVMRFDFPEEK